MTKKFLVVIVRVGIDSILLTVYINLITQN